MGTLTLVRHGQASFGAADYDQLSELGMRQCRRLGEYFGQRRRRFQAVLRGSLRRHEQSLDALLQGLGEARDDVQVFPALNEYDSAAVVRAIHPDPLPPARTPEAYREHFRLLRRGLAAWMEGHTRPEGMPSHADWVAGIAAVLDRVRTLDGEVLLVSSGGPISTAVGQVLGMPAVGTIELNMRIRNSAITEFAFNPRRHALHSFNHLPHLDGAGYEDWVTYA
ncbi:MAG: histidine phosphatase family protein [Rubrivivax sp.]|nr:histidine phosphatase family protein [Rubrivivax sp.]